VKIIDTQKIFENFLQKSIILVLCIWYYAVFPSLQNAKRLLFNHSYPRLSSLLLPSIADVATGMPFYLAKVGQPGGTPRTIARFHDSFRGSLPQIPCAIWVFHENSDGISWLILLSVAPCHMQVKRLYDDGLVDDNKKSSD